MSKDDAKSQQEKTDDNIDEHDSQEELSLDQLSQAYAQVMREQGQPVDDSQESDGELEGDTSEDAVAEDEDSNESTNQKTLEEIDADDNAPCAISPKSIIESLLFVGAPAGVKMTGRKLAAVMRDVSPKEVKKIVKELNKEYESENSAFRIVEESGDYKMKLTEDLIEVQNHYFGRNRPAKLSQGAIDVLAIVAYNQPISRKQVEQIRVKPSGTMISQLLKRELIEVGENKEAKEQVLITTKRFLELFGLGTLEDLPQTSIVSDLEELSDA